MRTSEEALEDAHQRAREFLDGRFPARTSSAPGVDLIVKRAGKGRIFALWLVPIEGVLREVVTVATLQSRPDDAVGATFEVFGSMPSPDYDGTEDDLRALYKGRP